MNIQDAELLGLAIATSEEISEEKEINGISFRVVVFSAVSADIKCEIKYSANFFKDGKSYLSINYDKELTPTSINSAGNDIPTELGNELLYQGAVSVNNLLGLNQEV